MAASGKKLTLAILVVSGATIYLAYLGAAESWQYYITTDEYAARPAEFNGHRVRVSGKIAAGSLHVEANRRRAKFLLAGTRCQLQVDCAGPLPDPLADTAEVVVEGHLDAAGLLLGDKLITRCPGKYQAKTAADTSRTPRAARTEKTP